MRRALDGAVGFALLAAVGLIAADTFAQQKTLKRTACGQLVVRRNDRQASRRKPDMGSQSERSPHFH